MALPQWTVANNYSLGVFEERVTLDQPLPISNINDVTTEVIAGSLPPGLRLENNIIVGTPLNVAKATRFAFVIRATADQGISDRTLTMTVEGADVPVWETPEGDLPIGPNGVYYILDSSPIDFQLLADDEDLPTGENLEYFVADGDGQLPPGITLTREGRLTGVVDPLRALDINEIRLGFDAGGYGSNVYDWGATTEDTVDSLYYGTVTLTNIDLTRPPRKLNRRYEFTVTVADTTSVAKRTFSIYVVSDDFVRADNTMMEAGDNVFTADATYIRNPIWITPSDLGIRRANNYQTIYLETLKQPDVSGAIKYVFKGSNPGTYRLTATGEEVKGYWDLSGILPNFPDSGRGPNSTDEDFLPDPLRPEEFITVIPETVSELPPGLQLDPDSGELAGIIPYQPTVTREYKFSVGALRYDEDKGVVTVFGTYWQDLLAGTSIIRVAKLPRGTADGIDDLNELVGKELEIEGRTYVVETVNGNNADYDEIILETPLQPLYSVNPFVVAEPALSGQDYFYVNTVATSDIPKVSGRELRFSDSEIYTIKDIYTYEKYSVSVNVGQSIELVTQIVPFDTDIETSLANFFLETTNRTSYTEINGNVMTLYVPSTATTRNKSYIAGLFHTSDSTAVKVELLDSFDKVSLDINLQRDFATGRNINFGLFRGNSFNKTFPVDEIDIIESVKTFDLRILGEVDSVITWKTPSDLGTIKANRTSLFRVVAETTLANAKVKYTLIGGHLPFGMTLKENGEIVGSVPVVGTPEKPGITRIDGGNTTFDGKATSFDREFKFTVLARDRLVYSATSKEFTITVDSVDSLSYSNIHMKPFLPVAQRSVLNSFVNNIDVFDPKVLYRPSDPEFGVQKELKSLVFAGIETASLGDYVAATTQNHRRKKFHFGEVKVAQAKMPGDEEVVYEVIYVDLVDPQKPKSGKAAKSFLSPGGKRITVDSVELEPIDDQFGGGTSGSFFPVVRKNNSIYNLTISSNRIQVEKRGGGLVDFETVTSLTFLNRIGGTVTINATILTSNQGLEETWRFRPDNTTLKADNTSVTVSENQNRRHYISNIDNMRDNIDAIGTKSKDFLPLWMQTAQPGSQKELGYVLAVPLAYVKPGSGEQIRLNIENYLRTNNDGFSFHRLDYDIDRYIINAVQGNNEDQYIVFGNYAYNA